MRKHEKQLHGIEDQQRKILATVRRETKELEGQRQSLVTQLEMERAKLTGVEVRIGQLTAASGSSSLPAAATVSSAGLQMDDSAESDSSESLEEEPLSLLQVRVFKNI